MKFFLIAILTLTDGAIYQEKREVRSYDQCYYEGLKIVKEIETNYDEQIIKLELECVAGVDV